MLNLPPWFSIIVLQIDLSHTSTAIERGRCNSPRIEQKAHLRESRIGQECPGRVTQLLVVLDAVVLHHVVHGLVWRLDIEIEAQTLQQDILAIQDCISPLPKILRLLVDQFIWILEGDSHACYNQLFHLAAVLLNLGGQKKCSCCNLLVEC